jgi:hypothetical protein
LSLRGIIEQIGQAEARRQELEKRSEAARDEVSRAFFRQQAEHYQTLKMNLQVMRATLERIEDRANAIARGDIPPPDDKS